MTLTLTRKIILALYRFHSTLDLNKNHEIICVLATSVRGLLKMKIRKYADEDQQQCAEIFQAALKVPPGLKFIRKVGIWTE